MEVRWDVVTRGGGGLLVNRVRLISPGEHDGPASSDSSSGLLESDSSLEACGEGRVEVPAASNVVSSDMADAPRE